MNNLNSIILEGNILSFEIGNVGAFFTIEVKRDYKNLDGSYEAEVSEFEVRCYGNMAASVERYGKINRGIRVVGRLKQEKYTDSDGKSCSKVIVIAEHIEFKPVNKD